MLTNRVDQLHRLVAALEPRCGLPVLALPGPVPDVDRDPASAWRAHPRAVGELLARSDVPATAYDGFFGPTTIGETLVQFYAPDMVVHRWDIASAVDGDTRFTDDELDRVEASVDSWGEAMYLDGICKAGVIPPVGASRQAVLLARTGRRAW